MARGMGKLKKKDFKKEKDYSERKTYMKFSKLIDTLRVFVCVGVCVLESEWHIKHWTA